MRTAYRGCLLFRCRASLAAPTCARCWRDSLLNFQSPIERALIQVLCEFVGVEYLINREYRTSYHCGPWRRHDNASYSDRFTNRRGADHEIDFKNVVKPLVEHDLETFR